MKKNNTDKRYKILCLFARERGLEVLKSLLNDRRFEVVGILTHSRLPKSEDPDRNIRPEYPFFKDLAKQYSIPLFVVDVFRESKDISFLRKINQFDFLITVSWRFLVLKQVFSRAKIVAINVHRGKLPTYAGARPIEKALGRGEKNITLSAHKMVEELDAGRVLVEKTYPVNFDKTRSIKENTERIKREMLPLYPKIVIEAMECYINRH